MTLSVEAAPSVGSARTVAPVQKKFRPVLWWAGLGAACAAVSLWAFAFWIISGDAKIISPGKTDVPLYMQIPIRAHEAVGVIALVIFFHIFLVRPWLRKRELTWDGMYLVASMLVFMSNDYLLNYTSVNTLYSSYMVNFGNWFCHLPGWVSPNGCRAPEPLLFSWTWYTWGFLGVAIIGCNLMRRAKARWPQISPLGLIGLCFIGCFLLDFALEFSYVLLGFYSFGGAAKGWTLFHGHYYQFPIYESILWGMGWTGMICIRFFKDDKDQSVYERGLDRVNIRPNAKKIISMFAILGAMNFLYFAFYNLPENWISLHQSAWPEDIQKRSYLTSQVCGPETLYACPGPGVPIPRPDSVHLDNQNRPSNDKLKEELPTPVTEFSDHDPGFSNNR